MPTGIYKRTKEHNQNIAKALEDRKLSAEHKQKIGEANIKHSASFTRLYKCWCGMKYRCSNPNEINFKYYGGRGIKVCGEWQNSFEAFRDWSLVSNYKDDLTLDRINNDGNYEPSNCEWITQLANNKKRKGSKYIKRGIKEMK